MGRQGIESSAADPADADGAGAGAPGGMGDGEVPDWQALGRPPSMRRFVVLGLMAAVMLGATAVLATLRSDVEYFFTPVAVQDLGAATGLDPAVVPTNRYVRIEGAPMAAHSAVYERMLGATPLAVFPLAGQRTVFVQIAAEELPSLQRRVFTGRLITFGEAGARFSPLLKHFADARHLPISAESFLLLDGDSPRSYAWALILALVCVLVLASDFALLVYWFRPLPVMAEPAKQVVRVL